MSLPDETHFGDRIAVVNTAGQIINTAVSTTFVEGSVATFGAPVNGRLLTYRLEDEGVTWIRGHHGVSAASRALLTASALVRDVGFESRNATKRSLFAMAYGGYGGVFNGKLSK